jgi:hypothetical protein
MDIVNVPCQIGRFLTRITAERICSALAPLGAQVRIESTGNVIYPAAFADKPVVVNPKRKRKRKGGHATRMKSVIGLNHRRQLRQEDMQRETRRAEEERAERVFARVAEVVRGENRQMWPLQGRTEKARLLKAFDLVAECAPKYTEVELRYLQRCLFLAVQTVATAKPYHAKDDWVPAG